MRILIVNKFLYIKGGSENYIFGLSKELIKNGHQVTFFGISDPRNTVDEVPYSLVNNIDFRKDSWKTWQYPFKVIYSNEARKKIRECIELFKPDIVHLNNFNFHLTPSIIYELHKKKIPMVLTVHDPFLICPSHSLYNFQTGQICEKCQGKKFFQCIRTRCIHDSLVKSIVGASEGYIYRLLNPYKYIYKMICPSKFMADKLIENGFYSEQLLVLHNYINFLGSPEPSTKDDYFLYFGRLSIEKGITTLLKAFKTLPDIRLVIAGDGPLKDQLKDQLIEMKNVEYVGFQSGSSLNELIQNSICSIYPSECYENCPVSILESLGLGTPVIGSRIGGIPELITDGVNGYLFEAGNYENLRQKIQMINDKRDLIKDMSVACITKSKQFSLDLYYEKILSIYKDAI